MRRNYAILPLIVFITLASAEAQTKPGGDRESSDVIYVMNEMAGNGLMRRLPAVLYEISLQNGQIGGKTTVAAGGPPGSDTGIDFMLPDYDRRVIAVGAPAVAPRDLSVVYFESPTAVHLPPVADYRGLSAISHFFSEDPAHRLQVTLLTSDGKEERLVGAPMQRDKVPELNAEHNFRGIRLGGYFGTVWDNPGGIDVSIREGQALRMYNGPNELIDMGIPSPGAPKAFRGMFLDRLNVRNDFALVVESRAESAFSRDGLGSSVHHIYCYAARGWRSLTLPGSTTRARAFGKWLAFVVSEAQPWAIPSEKNFIAYDPSVQRTSPGQAGRALNLLPTGPFEAEASMDELFGESQYWFPGILLLYNVETGRQYRLETGQGDSEVVLVDGSDVYYRVNTSLYRAKIGTDSVSGAEIVASDPVIGNVHCAFLGNRGSR